MLWASLAAALCVGLDETAFGLLSGDILILPSEVLFDWDTAFVAGFKAFDGCFVPPAADLAVDGLAVLDGTLRCVVVELVFNGCCNDL